MKLKTPRLTVLFFAILLLFTPIPTKAEVLETQTVTQDQTVSCSVYCYVAEEPAKIIIPKVYIEEPAQTVKSTKKVNLITAIIEKIRVLLKGGYAV